MYKNHNRLAECWTASAKDCYERGCKCEGCLIQEIIETKCFMKKVVFELVRKFGAPKENPLGLTDREQKVINAILQGANSQAEIAEKIGLTKENAQTVLNRLYPLAENDGVVYLSGYKFKEFVKWVRGKYEQ